MRKKPNKIKAFLAINGYTAEDVARASGYTRGNVWHVIHNRIKTPEIRKIICRLAEKTEQELWPEE